MKYDYDLIVLGGGSGGLVVSSTAVNLGARVALIESHKMGGDCLNYGCVPSKTFLKSAHTAREIINSYKYGVNVDESTINVDIKKIMSRVRSVIEEIEAHDSVERFESLGVDVFLGNPFFKNKNTICINEKELTAKKICIATGSSPRIPDIKGLNEIEFYTNETIFEIDEMPEHLVVLGAGPIGMELGQGFNYLGSKVTIIDRNLDLFKHEEPEVGEIFKGILTSEGIDLNLGFEVECINKLDEKISITIVCEGNRKNIICDMLLVCVGRKPNIEKLNLENIGIKLNEDGSIFTDDTLKTSVSNIFACGDVRNRLNFTQSASYQAGIVVINALFGLKNKVNNGKMVWTTYTSPEISHLGYNELQAREKGIFGNSIKVNLNDNDRCKVDDDREGFLKVILDNKNKVIVATLVAKDAGEMIPLLTYFVNKKLRLSGLLGVIFSYPTKSEIFKYASTVDLRSRYKNWHRRLISNIIKMR